MAETVYKVGDVLEFTKIVQKQFGVRAAPVRGLIVKVIDSGYEYKSYRFLLFGKDNASDNMTLCWAFEKDILAAAKRVGHIDISLLRFEKSETPSDDKNALLEVIQERERTIQNLNSRIESLTKEAHSLRTLANPKFGEFLNQCVNVKKLQDEIEALKKEVSDLRKENKDLSDRLGDEVSGKWDNWKESGGF